MFRRVSRIAVLLAVTFTTAFGSGDAQAEGNIVTDSATARDTASSTPTTPENAAGLSDDTDAERTLFDASVVHDIAVTYDEADYDAMIEAFVDTGEKQWIEATVTIDGVTYEQVGMRLKGNSSLGGLGGGGFPGGGFPDGGAPAGGPMEPEPDSTTPPGETTEPGTTVDSADGSLTDLLDERRASPGGGALGAAGPATADEPENLPWLIRLDEFVEGQDHQGYEDLVVRSNNSETSMNEAVALELLERAGLASQQAVSTTFRVNDRAAVLRLAIEHPDDDAWQEAWFDSDGALYKAESTGDWSYRGDDPDAYEEVWDQEGGSDLADLTPLLEFLQFLNESDDTTFAAELPARLDVDSFATYLAMMDLVENFDDIDGPGNNAYLWYDVAGEQFTVVPWDLNLAFSRGVFGGDAGDSGAFPPDGSVPENFEPPFGGSLPDDFPLPAGGSLPDDVALSTGGSLPDGVVRPTVRVGGFGRSNILVERFHANTEFEALYQQKLTDLRAELYDTGAADEIVATWAAMLSAQVGDLVDNETIDEEAQAISEQFLAE